MIPRISERALVLAPRGRDAKVAAAVLEEAGTRTAICDSLAELVNEIQGGAGIAVVTDDALLTADLKPLATWLAEQPPWSDFPFILLTEHGGGLERNPVASRHLELLGNVTFIERPFHPTTLISLARSALRGRRRQYEARSHLEALHDSERELRALAADLEDRVATRTAELQINERRLRTLFETSFMFQCLITPEGLVVDANAASLQAIGADRTHILGRPLWETPWLAGTPELIGPLRERFPLVAKGETLRRELTVNLPSGPRTFDLSLRPMYGEAGEVAAVVMEAMDITQRRQAEEALRQSQKLEAIGQLTGGVAHDFNNLLMPIIGALDILQRRYAGKTLDERAVTLMDNAAQSAERAKILVQRLLGFARRQALDTRPVDIAALVEGMRDLVKSSVGANVTLRITCEAGLPPALADPNQLELAILNLCVNARDAMSDGGEIVVGVDDQAPRPEISAQDLGPGRFIRLFVVDHGKGMDADTLGRAVEPFFSTKPLGQGTGLGLSMVHGLVTQLGGAFDLVSAPGQGTTASLYLPVTESATAALGPAPRSATPADRPLSILLVDDEDLVRNGTAEMLRELGHKVTESPGGVEALARVDEGLTFDLLVTDYKMPRMNGAELAKRIQSLRPDAAILLISGYIGVEDEAPDFVRLTKPFRQADLARALVRIAA